MRLVGPIFILFFYLVLSVHIYAHFAVVLFVLKKRLGVMFGLLWVAIGASLFYNIVYNQFFAMLVKGGGGVEAGPRGEGVDNGLVPKEQLQEIIPHWGGGGPDNNP